MATVTFGTVNATALAGLQIIAGQNSIADLATLRANIKNDQNAPPRPVWPGALEGGILSLPNRSPVALRQGDWVAVDTASGQVIVVFGSVLPSTLQTTASLASGSAVVTSLGTNISVLGWVPGMVVAGSNLTAGSTILSIAPGGSSLTLSLVAGTSVAGQTLTAGGAFTHG